jgi:membrane-associated phospholipid phosphatase
MKHHVRVFLSLAIAVVFASLSIATARADEVTDWNQILFQAAHIANTNPLDMSRNAAIVQSSVFDAVNGISRRYTPIHVKPAAPWGASPRAAAIQAAYANLVRLYPAQQSTLDAQRAASLAALVGKGHGHERQEAIDNGVHWGQEVADSIWAWRSTDGFTTALPPFLGGTNVGQWRPTPPGFVPGFGAQYPNMTPWVIKTQSQFRPAGTPALTSAQYTKDFNETKSMGSLTSLTRTADQTLFSQFWNVSTASFYWNRIALFLLGKEHHTTLEENALILAAVDVAMADAAIACWEAKYHYVAWRPVTAIPLADTDGNPATSADPSWTPLLITPPFPEYPSGHSTVSAAAATVLAHYFGRNSSFMVDSDVMTGVVRSFPNFSAALVEIVNARVYGGIHFRTACNDGQATGTAVGEYILQHAFRRADGDERDDED